MFFASSEKKEYFLFVMKLFEFLFSNMFLPKHKVLKKWSIIKQWDEEETDRRSSWTPNSRPYWLLTMLEIRYGFASQSQQRIWYPNSHENFKYNLSFSSPFPWFTETFCPNLIDILTLNSHLVRIMQWPRSLCSAFWHLTPYTLQLTHSHRICLQLGGNNKFLWFAITQNVYASQHNRKQEANIFTPWY